MRIKFKPFATCHFMRLPTEVRMAIYPYLFGDLTSLNVQIIQANGSQKSKLCCSSVHDLVKQLPRNLGTLVRVNHLVRGEILS